MVKRILLKSAEVAVSCALVSVMFTFADALMLYAATRDMRK
jgi:hypothetical protein